MPTLADLLKDYLSPDNPEKRYLTPSPSPVQPPQGGTEGVEPPAKTSGASGAPSGSSLSSIVSGFNLPDYNTPEGVRKSLESILGPRPTMDESLAAARKEFGEYDVPPPNRQAYGYQPTQISTPGLFGALGVLFGGGNLGAYARGVETSLGRQQQDAFAQLRAQQDYDTALRNWQAGKAGWTKDIVQAARDRMNAWRSEASTLAPYVLSRQGDILRAQTAAHADALKYLSGQAQLEYRYFAESKLTEFRNAHLLIQQRNSDVREAFNNARIAIEGGNQELAKQRLGLLSQATSAKIQQEQAITQLLQTKIQQVDLQEAERGFNQTAKEIEVTVNEINQLQGTASPATQYLLEGLNVHLQQLIKQRDLYNTRLQQLQTQPKPQPQPASTSGSQTAPGSTGSLTTGTYQGRPAITDGVHIWDANTHELLK